MSTFYASFPEAASAQTVAVALLTDGVNPDDISVVTHESSAPMSAEESGAIEPQEDASYFVGRPDDPEPDTSIEQAREDAASFGLESRVGGGISTSTPDEAVGSYEELDDTEPIEADLLYPQSERPLTDPEFEDLDLAVNTGFPTAVPQDDSPRQSRLGSNTPGLPGFDSVVIPGFGRVMGGGSLATAALDLGKAGAGGTLELLTQYLTGEGMPPRAAQDMAHKVQDGGALLAVALVPGTVDSDRLQQLVASNGASESGTFDAPRF